MGLDELEKQITHPLRFLAKLLHVRAGGDPNAHFERRHREDGRCAAKLPIDPGSGAIVRIESEGRFMPHPSAQRRVDVVLVTLCHEDERGRAGAFKYL